MFDYIFTLCIIDLLLVFINGYCFYILLYFFYNVYWYYSYVFSLFSHMFLIVFGLFFNDLYWSLSVFMYFGGLFIYTALYWCSILSLGKYLALLIVADLFIYYALLICIDFYEFVLHVIDLYWCSSVSIYFWYFWVLICSFIVLCLPLFMEFIMSDLFSYCLSLLMLIEFNCYFYFALFIPILFVLMVDLLFLAKNIVIYWFIYCCWFVLIAYIFIFIIALFLLLILCILFLFIVFYCFYCFIFLELFHIFITWYYFYWDFCYWIIEFQWFRLIRIFLLCWLSLNFIDILFIFHMVLYLFFLVIYLLLIILILVFYWYYSFVIFVVAYFVYICLFLLF